MEEQENANFWTVQRRQERKVAHQRLVDAVLHGKQLEQLEQVWQHLRMRPQALIHYGCGITDRVIECAQCQWMLFPYQTGYNLVRIPEIKEGEKVEDKITDYPMHDSQLHQSFFGVNTIENSPGGRLFITQLPLECLMLWNILGDFGGDEVISYLLPFQAYPTPQQSLWLSENSWDEVFVFQNCNNELVPGNRKIGVNYISMQTPSADVWSIDLERITGGRFTTLLEMLTKPVTLNYLNDVIDQAERCRTPFD